MRQSKILLIIFFMALSVLLSSPASAALIWFVTQGTGGDYQQDAGHLFTWDPASSSVTDRGFLNTGAWTDIAMTPDGVLYGIRWTNGVYGGGTDLYVITPGSDQSPASYQQVNGSYLPDNLNSLGWADGGLWAAESETTSGQNDLWFFDLATGSWQNKNNEFITGGDVELGSDGTLYAFSDGTAPSGLYAVNRTTGVPSYIGDVDIPGSSNDLFYGMAFDSDTGAMYGFNAGAGRGYGQGSDIYMIDPSTGTPTLAFDLASSVGVLDNVWGATSTPVPIPGAVWLLGSGLLGVVGLRRRLVS